MNCFLPEGEPPKGSLGSCRASAAYASFDLGSSTVRGCQSGLWFILPFHFGSPSQSPAKPHIHSSTLQATAGVLGCLVFPVVTLALWPLSSSLPQPQGWCSNLPAWFSLKLLSVLISQPSWMGLLSQTQYFLPCNREAPHLLGVPTQRREWPPLETRPWLWYAVIQPGFLEYVGDQTSSPCMGQWGLITSSISQHYSHLYTIMSSVFRGRWVVSLMFRGYWPLWWWSASYPEPKRHFGEALGWESTSSSRSNFFYWVPYHVTILPILWWWKGGGTFLWVCTPFVCSLMFPHAMAEASLMHC